MQQTHPFSIKFLKKSKLQDPNTTLDSILLQMDLQNEPITPTKFVSALDQRLRGLSLQENKENIPPTHLEDIKNQNDFKHIKSSKRRTSIDEIEGLFEILEGHNKNEPGKSNKKVVLPAKKSNQVQTTLSFKPSMKKTASASKSLSKVNQPIEENNVIICERILH